MRRPDWERRLNEYVTSRRMETYQVGEHDCAIFAVRCAEVITGQSYGEGLQGLYDTVDGGLDLLAERGYRRGLYGFLRAKFGKPTRGSMGKRGDIAWLNGAAGVMMGRYALFVVEDERLFEMVSISRIQRAFRVG